MTPRFVVVIVVATKVRLHGLPSIDKKVILKQSQVAHGGELVCRLVVQMVQNMGVTLGYREIHGCFFVGF